MIKKIIPIVIILVLLLSTIAPSVYALTDIYNYTTNKENIKREDNFTFRNDCFTRSSYLGCSHLEILSAQVSEASASSNVKEENDVFKNGKNLTEMLKKMGFEDVSTNEYYSTEKEENSVGVAVGHKNIKVNDKDYTLIAVMPRSGAYKLEWSGNFNIGNGDIHEGFKAARDEVIRYVNKYFKDNNIQGNLKVWTTGHSRGAAISNMVAGFFAGGGIEYFENNVSITPEDVYCYTFATPNTIKKSASKNVELSVEANRKDKGYENDTVGKAYIYKKGGIVETQREIYGGIRNFISQNDIVTMVPPESWGFSRYGQDIEIGHNKVTEEAMLNELKEISSSVYNRYIDGANPKSFKRKTFDLKKLSIVNEKSNSDTYSSFLKKRIAGLTHVIKTNKIYNNDGYQDVLKAIAGIYGISDSALVDSLTENQNDLIFCAIISYIACASEQMQENGKASNETEAITLILEELLSHYTNEKINSETFSIHDLLMLVTKYIADNEKEHISDFVVGGIVSLIPEEYQTLFETFKQFDKNNKENEVSAQDGLKAFIRACYYGVDPECEIADIIDDESQLTDLLYGVISIALNTYVSGETKVEELVDAILEKFTVVKDNEDNVIKTYSNLGELADEKNLEVLDKVFKKLIEKLSGNSYQSTVKQQVNDIKNNISKVRELAVNLLFYEDGKYSIIKDISNLTTLIDNIKILPLAHYNEIYLAYAKASKNFDCGYEDHDIKYTCLEGKDKTFDIDKNNVLSFRFDIDYDVFVKEGKIYIDNNEVSKDNYKLTKGSTIVTFNDEYTKGLSVGKHNIKASTEEGYAEVEFTIAKTNTSVEKIEDNKTDNTEDNKVENVQENQKKSSNPITGDNIILWIGLMGISVLGFIMVKNHLKKRKH